MVPGGAATFRNLVVPTFNRFQALAQDNADEDDMEVPNICQVEELEMSGDSMTCNLTKECQSSGATTR